MKYLLGKFNFFFICERILAVFTLCYHPLVLMSVDCRGGVVQVLNLLAELYTSFMLLSHSQRRWIWLHFGPNFFTLNDVSCKQNHQSNLMHAQ